MNKNSKFARVLRRFLGEETGATMMEYVILAVMIAAAVTAAAIYFGEGAKNQMNVAGDAMVGKVDSAETRAGNSMKAQKAHATAASDSAKTFKTMTAGPEEVNGN